MYEQLYKIYKLFQTAFYRTYGWNVLITSASVRGLRWAKLNSQQELWLQRFRIKLWIYNVKYYTIIRYAWNSNRRSSVQQVRSLYILPLFYVNFILTIYPFGIRLMHLNSRWFYNTLFNSHERVCIFKS